MASRGFAGAFAENLHRGMQYGLQREQLDLQLEAQKSAEADKLHQRKMQAWQQMQAIMQLPPSMRATMFKMGAGAYRELTGEDFPQEMAEALSKADADEAAAWEAGASLFAEQGYSIDQVFKIGRQNPGAFAQAVTLGLKLREEQRAQTESEELRRIASGGTPEPFAGFQDKAVELGQPQGVRGIAQHRPLIQKYAEQFEVDPLLAEAVAIVESSGNPSAVGDSGKAIGLYQLHDATARDVGVDRHTLEGNVEGGVGYLRQMLNRFGGNPFKALAAYNTGPGTVETQGVTTKGREYVQRVQQVYQQLRAASQGQPQGQPSGGSLDARIEGLRGKLAQLQGLTSPQANRVRDDLRAELQMLTQERERGQGRARQQEMDNLRRRESILHPEGYRARMDIAEAQSGIRQAEKPLPPAMAKEINSMDATLDNLTEIQKLYNSEYVGPVAGRTGGMMERFGGIGKKEAQFRALVSQQLAEAAHEKYGAALTANEIRMLKTHALDLNLPEEVFEARLEIQMSILNRARQRLLQTAQQSGYKNMPGQRGTPPPLGKRPPKPFSQMSPEELEAYGNEEVD